MISTDNTHSQLHIKQAGSNAEKTLPEAQPTQSIESVPQINSTACFHLNLRDNSRYRVNTLGPLCLWQCLQISISMAVLTCTALAMMMKMGEKKITMTMILMKRFYVDFLPDEVVGSVHLGFASDNQDGWEQWKEALQFPDTPCIKCYPLN